VLVPLIPAGVRVSSAYQKNRCPCCPPTCPPCSGVTSAGVREPPPAVYHACQAFQGQVRSACGTHNCTTNTAQWLGSMNAATHLERHIGALNLQIAEREQEIEHWQQMSVSIVSCAARNNPGIGFCHSCRRSKRMRENGKLMSMGCATARNSPSAFAGEQATRL